MKRYIKFNQLISVVVIITLFSCCFPGFVVEATDGYENNTDSYNCYAYAINRVDELDVNNDRFYNPAQTEKIYQPGDISKNISNTFYIDLNGSNEDNINRVKCNTLRDLYAMGHTDVMVYNLVRNINVYNAMLASIDFSTQELICFRVGPSDYHFMRYDSVTNAWYNKNGYDPIYKYTDNGGIPSNNVHWVSGSNVYDSEIIYIVYDKLRINIPENGELEQNITVKGGVANGLNYNPIYCCGDEACCNPDGVCSCGNEIVYGGKDVVYELIMPELCDYSIRLTSNDSNFNYQLYSYNIYNGNYVLHASGSSIQNGTLYEVNLISSLTVGKYYLRMDFGKNSDSDKTISLVAHSTPHSYTDHYESASSLFHKAYCECGAFDFQQHIMVDGECSFCGEIHIHDYTEWEYYSNTNHIEKCSCGQIGTHKAAHTVRSGIGRFKECIICGGTVDTFSGPNQLESTINMVTANGSYILPNGVIVLVDEDIEAYFKGELVFYNINDSSEAS